MTVPPIAGALAEVLIAEATRLAGAEWALLREELEPRLRALAHDAESAADALMAGEISAEQARHILHLQRLALGSILRHGRVLAAVRASRMVDGLLSLAAAGLALPAGETGHQRL